MTGEPILPARTANQYLAIYWFAVRAGKIGSPVRRFIINRVPPAGGTAAPSVPIYASAAYGCALAHLPQTTREVRATFYSRLSQYGPHAAPCTFGREPVKLVHRSGDLSLVYFAYRIASDGVCVIVYV
jgi:hypothetical protein